MPPPRSSSSIVRSRSTRPTRSRSRRRAEWLPRAVPTGVIPAFDNPTCQPRAALRRVDLAEAVSALLRVIARTHPGLQAQLAARPAVSDMEPAHLNYQAVAAAVSAGVLPLLPDGR